MNQYTKPTDHPEITALEQRAMWNAKGNDTGIASQGDVTVRYYPVSGRFAWFDERGACTKRVAVWKLGVRP